MTQRLIAMADVLSWESGARFGALSVLLDPRQKSAPLLTRRGYAVPCNPRSEFCAVPRGHTGGSPHDSISNSKKPLNRFLNARTVSKIKNASLNREENKTLMKMTIYFLEVKQPCCLPGHSPYNPVTATVTDKMHTQQSKVVGYAVFILRNIFDII